MKIGLIHIRYRVARISFGMSIVVIGSVLCIEDLGLEEEDCDAMIIKQRKNSGRRDQRIYFVCYHVDTDANKMQFYSFKGCVYKCTRGCRSDYREHQQITLFRSI